MRRLFDLVHALFSALLLAAVVSTAANAQHRNSLEEHYVWERIKSHKIDRLACPRGTLAIGLTYLKGKTLDSLHFICKEPIYARTVFLTWSAQTPTLYASVGGQGGKTGQYNLDCPEGMAISGLRGVNKNWGEHWLMLSISIECAQIIQKNPWAIAKKQGVNPRATQATRTYIFAGDDIDNYNSAGPFIITRDPNKSSFLFECRSTPLALLEVRLAEWKLFMGGLTDVVHGIRWRCF